jgi:hypothetical protein
MRDNRFSSVNNVSARWCCAASVSMPLRPRQPIAPANAAKGAAAELAFRQWLDAAVLPHIYVEQSP